MKDKEWVDVDFEECPNCGDTLEALTNCGVVDGMQHFWDGDKVRCLGRCDAELQITVDARCASVSGEW